MCLPVKPFKVESEFKHAGLQCAVVQNTEAGFRCGYVRVPPTHPMFEKGYDDLDVDVHGGLTFAELEPCTEHEDGQGYWFGFDCCHAGDEMYDPSMRPVDCTTEEAKRLLQIHSHYPRRSWEHYWTQEEIESETKRLAEQLAAVA
jgi:hypothetical protein